MYRRPDEASPALSNAATDPADSPPTVSEREAALQRVCAGFETEISPRSAARLASLLSASGYVRAA